VNPGIPEDQYGVEESDAQAWGVSITQLVERHLASRGWSQSDLARVLGWSPQFLSDVINRRTRIRPRDAIDLGCALGEEPDVLLAIQTKGQLLEALIDLKTSERLRSISARRRIEEILPSREMIRRGILPDGSPEEIEHAVLGVFGVESIDLLCKLPAAARRNRSLESGLTRPQLAWLGEARTKHRVGLPRTADPEALRALGASLSTTVLTHDDMRGLPTRFAEFGITLTFVPPYPGAKIDGVCTLVDGHPLIAVSGRGGRWDKVMFTIAHELAHVAMGHLDSTSLFVTDASITSSSGVEIQEAQADLCAGHWLIPSIDALRCRPLSVAAIEDFAQREGIPLSLVIGRLQSEGLLPWTSRLNKRIDSVKEDIETWI